MRRATLLFATATAILLPAPPTGANGGAVFDFVDPYLEIGTEVQGSTVVWMSEKDPRLLERGPFYAYLVPEGRWIRPPRLPAGSIRVGTIGFRWLSDRKAAATLSFTVPDLPSGRYGLHYCDDPCTTAAIGDLYAGSVLIARDPEVGALLLEKEKLQAQVSSARWRHKRASRQITKLEEAAAAAEAPDPRIVELEAQLRDARELPQDQGAPTLPWLVAAGALGVGFVIGRRRRRARPAAPADAPTRHAVRELEPVS